MKFTPSSTARRSTRTASSGSFGSPQMPGPVSRIEPNPSRFTVSSPRVKLPACAADTTLCAMTFLQSSGRASLRSAYDGKKLFMRQDFWPTTPFAGLDRVPECLFGRRDVVPETGGRDAVVERHTINSLATVEAHEPGAGVG